MIKENLIKVLHEMENEILKKDDLFEVRKMSL